MKILSGAEIAGYMKENQAHQVRSLRAQKIFPKLVIIRDSDDPVITKYVTLKRRYGEDIAISVEDWCCDDVAHGIVEANMRSDVHGIIVQLPIKNRDQTDEIVNKIAPEKDVDGLASDLAMQNNKKVFFESATATAINWLLAGYDIDLTKRKIALVGYGRLVGKPLERMWRKSNLDVTIFRHNSDLSLLKNFSLIVSATGVPHLIKSEMVKSDAVLVDAGTASEGGVLVGDIDDSVRERVDLAAITPKIGGVGPLTVTTLFEHVLMAAKGVSRE